MVVVAVRGVIIAETSGIGGCAVDVVIAADDVVIIAEDAMVCIDARVMDCC